MLESARIGIDFGRVVMGAAGTDGRADTSFLDESEDGAMEIAPSERAFDVIREIAARSRGQVWLVSKAGPRIQKLTRKWLFRWRFFEETGIAESHLIFCRERKEKALHARKLRLSHFIDDRMDVHTHLRGVVPALYLFGHQRAGTVVPDWVTPVLTWHEVRGALFHPGGAGNTM